MINLYDRISADPEYHISRVFLQFEKFGAIINYDAVILKDQDLIRGKDHCFPESTEPLKLYRLTDLGKRRLRHIQDRWANHFVQKYALPSNEIPDDYLNMGDDYFWAFSKERLEIERNAGRINQLIDRSA